MLPKLKGNQTLTASVTLTNSGNYDGEEVVQLYIRDLVGKVVRPVKELERFSKNIPETGESKTVSFNITLEDLKFYDDELNFDWESGEFGHHDRNQFCSRYKPKVNWKK